MENSAKTKLKFIAACLLFWFAVWLLTGCANTSVYQPVVVEGAKGQTVKAVKVLGVGGDINGAFTLETQPNGSVKLQVLPLEGSQVIMQRIAVTDSKGNPLLDKEGRPIFNEIPLVAGLNHSFPTAARGDAISKVIRSGGSVAGTVAASVAGAEAANQLARAIPQ
jgi:hypothetical protein